ncbi:RNA polymerase sigma factor [Carnobacterium gallinarum]|uniref:RNA polymerase sigma factor n=1 Tax=Carnobacterium gallinarum TaxID=2749 RepID=UPI0005566483|nr:RNA polymerase sigma factor [Carnobacterium gallinarum]
MRSVKNHYQKMEELYQLYEQKIYYVAYSILSNVQQAEDITQETFITLYQNLEKISLLDTHELKSYILKIAKNKAIDSYRKNQRQALFIEEYQKEVNEAETSTKNQEQYLMSEAQMDTLLSTLSDSYKKVFKYKIFYGLNYQETSELMGITEATARKQFERAKKRVMNIIGGSPNDEFEELKKNR